MPRRTKVRKSQRRKRLVPKVDHRKERTALARLGLTMVDVERADRRRRGLFD